MIFRTFWPILLSAISIGSFGQVDAHKIIAESIAANEASARDSAQWLGREDVRHYVKDREGRRKQTSWFTYEALVLEGAPYYRLTGVNGKAISKRMERAEQRRLDEETAYRRQMPLAERQYHGPRIGFRLSGATLAHDLRLLGSEQIDGRTVWVVEGSLRPDARMAQNAMEGALASDFTLWIDEKTKLTVREEFRLRRPFHGIREGSVGIKEYDLRPEARLAAKWTLRILASGGATGETEQMYSNYRRFEAIAAIEYETAQ